MSGNPVTNSLLSRIDDESLHRWVDMWGQLERLAVSVYRCERAGWRARRRYRALRRQLNAGYAGWQDEFAGHWEGQTVGGKPLIVDPFASLLAIESASDLVDNWPALQLLPAAREALNGYLVARIAISQDAGMPGESEGLARNEEESQ
ncbi:MAG: hypothetical protein WBR18_01920 [Anaerolineales bacterium]